MSPVLRDGRIDENDQLETVEESASAQARTKEATSHRAVATLNDPNNGVMLFAGDSITSETRELEPLRTSEPKLVDDLMVKRPVASNKVKRDGSSESRSVERER